MTKTIRKILDKIGSLTHSQEILLILFFSLIGISLLIRVSYLNVASSDYTVFLKPWIDHLRQRGLSGLGDNFSNYNAPYLLLLWLSSLLPVSDIVAVKMISIIFDFIMAFFVFKVVGQFKTRGYIKYLSALAVLFAPTVIQNSALWGQCDVIYTTFTIISFYYLLKNKINLMWLFWGIAFSFKLQAIFFVPFLVFFTIYKKAPLLKNILIAAAAIILLSTFPIMFGKSLSQVALVYINQILLYKDLRLFAINFYVFVPNNAFVNQTEEAGILFAIALSLAIVSLAVIKNRAKYNKSTLLLIATLCLLILPYFLPRMHERYFYSAEIFLIICAFVSSKYIIPAISMQLITTMANISVLTKQLIPIKPVYLSLIVLGIIVYLCWNIYLDIRQITRSNLKITAN